MKGLRYPSPEHPSDAWVISEREEKRLYPDDWIDNLQGSDAWSNCPWFLDYPDGKFPEDERDAYNGWISFALSLINSMRMHCFHLNF